MITKIQNLKSQLQAVEDIDVIFPELEMFQHELHSAGYKDESALLYWCLSSHNCDIDDVTVALNLLERLIG